jgi:hypothetical protein
MSTPEARIKKQEARACTTPAHEESKIPYSCHPLPALLKDQHLRVYIKLNFLSLPFNHEKLQHTQHNPASLNNSAKCAPAPLG